MKSRGAVLYPAAAQRDTEIANNALQARRCAMFPTLILDLYKHVSAISLDCGYIFGPIEIARKSQFPIPSIVDINVELSGIPALHGKTIFGRNDLFFFAFDAFGVFVILDKLNLRILKKYDDPYRAMSDCLLGGKF